jgi:predicted exporter
MSLLWIGATAILAIVVTAQLALTFDLGAFLPRQKTLLHEVLVEQIRSGPASRLMIIGINGASQDVLADASEQMKQALAAELRFASVANGKLALDDAQVPAPIDRYFLLMRDLDFGADSLDAAAQSRLRDLAFAGGRPLVDLIARDPFLATLDVLSELAPADAGGALWFAEDGSAVLIAETRAASIDIGAQRVAIEAVRGAFEDLPDASSLEIEITGVGAFSVELQESIRTEAMVRSILASAALILVLFLAFRSVRLTLVAALPLAMGFLGGLALVSVWFDEVHAITLAFGFTMLGVAIDYPIHLLSRAQTEPAPETITRIWPTMRLGVISTSVAYLALLFAGSSGLAQLGAFTAAGVAVAMLVTRTWLPLLVQRRAPENVSDKGPLLKSELSWSFALMVMLSMTAIVLYFTRGGLWNDDVSSLSPVPAERLAADRTLRAAAATPDMRYQLVLTSSSLEALLVDCERADPLLAAARTAGLLDGWQSVCQLLPSRQRQAVRQAAIPDETTLRDRMRDAIQGTPFRDDAFEPFLQSAAAASRLRVLERADVAATPLGTWLDSHLLELESGWVALISLVGPDPPALAEQVEQWPVSASIVDIQASSTELMQSYRSGALNVIGIAALLIVALLWFDRGRLRDTLWICLSVSAALASSVAVATIVHGSLTVVHMIALLLVLGLGLDYALFVTRVESADERLRTRRSVFLCAVSTTLAFGILAGSSIPVLQYIGVTVATGSAAMYLLAYLGSSSRRERAG